LEALIRRSTSLINSPVRTFLQVREGIRAKEVRRKIMGRKVRKENILRRVVRDSKQEEMRR
jgi:hypothetical protein